MKDIGCCIHYSPCTSGFHIYNIKRDLVSFHINLERHKQKSCKNRLFLFAFQLFRVLHFVTQFYVDIGKKKKKLSVYDHRILVPCSHAVMTVLYNWFTNLSQMCLTLKNKHQILSWKVGANVQRLSPSFPSSNLYGLLLCRRHMISTGDVQRWLISPCIQILTKR